MGSNPGFRTSRARVRGLGAAGEGTHHFWQQRLTAVAMIPLTVLFVVPFARALGQSHDYVLALYANPWQALIAVLFIGVGFRHLALGLQVVIERLTAGVPGFSSPTPCSVFALAGIFAVAKMALAG